MNTPQIDMARLRLNELLHGPKDSATIHYDEDTVPHGACDDPLHCDCMCPHCWAAKVVIIETAMAVRLAQAERERDEARAQFDRHVEWAADQAPAPARRPAP